MTQRNSYLLILIAVIVASAIYIILPNSPGIHAFGIQREFTTRLGLDLVGGVQALLEADLPPETIIEPGALDAATKVVENRVNGLGLTEAVVQKAGDRRIVVELPGETDPEKALETIQQTGLLELVDFSSISQAEASTLVGSRITTDFGLSSEQITQPITGTAAISQTFPTVITGADLRSVNVTTNPTTGEYEVAFTLSPKGKDVFAAFTSKHVGDILAIVVDKEVISIPSINSPIPDGQGVINGNFSYEEANNLAVQLRYGSLPIPLKVIEVRTIGPTLGMESLQKSLRAGAIGFTIVILFMLLYYRLPGLMANIAIIIFAMITFAIFRFIPVTLTLPGIAGFLLSTGSALDANILIFERMKEELRNGKTLRQSVELGWSRAWPSIRDSNIATLITCTILFWFGSTYGATVVKGFSITLFLGVIVSLFSAIVVTRVLMDLVVANFKSKDFPKWFGI
ncbi:MAG: protein translocase subunit SecD [Anaerolineae bacterium UTCFX2]|jgi:preprotein translocase subunit SecD|nr:protein translocase subunit SecD [Anaerolineales bacterium]OQY90866.1 MAG: protein translocase subunit SecD [Anaerolineae bacterium UTCFX2]